jgi:hypothetical protein
MSIELHIERLVIDEALLGGERASSVREAIERNPVSSIRGAASVPWRCCHRPAIRIHAWVRASRRQCSRALVSLFPRSLLARSIDMRAIPKPHPGGILRFGKRKAKRDDRNLMFAALLKAPPSLPTEYDFDVVHYGIPTPIFGNDQYGDCVIAGRAHQPLRFEKAKKNTLIGITDQDVLREYVSETGGSDSGLIVLDSLKECRRKGWRAAKRRHKIKAFTRIDQGKRSEVSARGS